MDALDVIDWAMHVAGIPPSRILIFAQSMGTAVSIAVSNHLALQDPPVVFAGTVLVAPFVDVATLVSTYRVAGTIPIISPLARFSLIFKYLQRFIRDKWLSKDSIAQYIRANEFDEEKYRLTIIHAEDDYDIPWHHSQLLFWHAVNASTSTGISYHDIEQKKLDSKVDLGAAGSMMEWRTNNGVIREEILKTGLHDVWLHSLEWFPRWRRFEAFMAERPPQPEANKKQDSEESSSASISSDRQQLIAAQELAKHLRAELG